MSSVPRIAALLFYLSSLVWVYVYLYPLWQGCGFPLVQFESDPPRAPVQFPFFQHDEAREAPFRLLVLADPQLEGDSSLPAINWLSFSTLLPWKFAWRILQTFQLVRKKVDLWGNDRFLAHLYRGLQTFTNPTHVTVLGDLLGSQWIKDDEFERRADRFWNVVVSGSEPVPEFLTRQPTTQVLGEEESWKTRIIAIAGNHDIGYAGDMTEERAARFERRFGRSNWEIEFELPARKKDSSAGDPVGAAYPKGAFEFAEQEKVKRNRQPKIRIMILNSMNLDTPAFAPRLQTESYAFLNSFMSRSDKVEESKDVLTLMLTHVPLYKRNGTCVDGPYFEFHEEKYGSGVKAQNLLSDYVSRILLEGVYGMSDVSWGRPGLIMTGHDHEGCDLWHFLPTDEARQGQEAFEQHRWNATKFHQRGQVPTAKGVPGIREVTLRAMQGDYGGNAVFLSAWFDEAAGRWGYGVSKCSFGSQHIWWAAHILFLVTAGLGSFAIYDWQAKSIKNRSEKRMEERQKAKAAKEKSVRRR